MAITGMALRSISINMNHVLYLYNKRIRIEPKYCFSFLAGTGLPMVIVINCGQSWFVYKLFIIIVVYLGSYFLVFKFVSFFVLISQTCS